MKTGRYFTPHILIGSNLINFCRVIFRLNFSLKAQAIPRLFVTFFILIMFTPFRIIETLLYFFTKKEAVKQPIFIIGHPRSGTTFFHDSLNELDDLVAPRMIDCLFPFLNKYFTFLLIPILKNALPETRLMDKMKVSWDSPQEEEFGMALMSPASSVAFLFAPKNSESILNNYILLNDQKSKSKWLKTHFRFAQKIQSLNKGKTLVFKSPGNTARIIELLEIYPDAKFIHITRNPQDVIPSTLNLYQKILPEFSLQDENQLNLTEFVFDYYAQVMTKILSTRSELTHEQLYELKYEDFTANPVATMNKAFTGLKIPIESEGLVTFFEARSNFSKNKFNSDPELAEIINKRCAEVIETYQYN